jgi:imidazolonepropionase-like amidohydrolase
MIRLVLCCAAALPLAAASADTFVLRGATVHPVTSPPIENAILYVKDGRIAGLGAKLAAPKGVRLVEAKGLHVYPGIIDSATQIGLSEIGAVRESVDTNEIGNFNPQLKALSAVNPASEHIAVTRANGITAALTMPGGGIIGGQAALIHLEGWTWEEMAVRPSAALVLRYPVLESGTARASTRTPALPLAERRRNLEKQLAELRQFFEQARRYQKAKQAQAAGFRTDLKMEAMLPVLEGKLPVLVFAAREKAIREAIQFAEREKIRMILADPRQAVPVAGELKAKNIPVILGPTMAAPLEEDDPYDRVATTPAELHKAGVKFAFGTFATSSSRNLPYQAANAVAYGLPYEEALKALTINPAEIWGVAAEYGSIEIGKWADLMVTDGDPLEVRTQVRQLYIKGKPVDLDNRHKRLYERYTARPSSNAR